MINARTGLIIISVIFVLFLLSVISKTKDYDCSDFKTQVEAYKVFRKTSGDIYKLDADNDGVPCEEIKD